jgi:hypothetical protein
MATIIIPTITAQNDSVQNLGVVTTNDQGQTNYTTQTSAQILFPTEVANISTTGSGISYDSGTSTLVVTGSVTVQLTINTTTGDVSQIADNPATAQLFDVTDTAAPVEVGLPWTLGGSHTMVFTAGTSGDFAVYAQAPQGQAFAYPARLTNSELAACILYND